MERIEVSPEMLAFVGEAGERDGGWPPHPVVLRFHLSSTPTCDVGIHTGSAADVSFVVATDACRRIFKHVPAEGSWHLPADARVIALAIRDCALPVAARETYRLGKCIELLCAVCAALAKDELVPAVSSEMNELDSRRLFAARSMVDTRWQEKLTLDLIARSCGLNRAKLTRGFRAMFATTVAHALAERRLSGARTMLLATDLPVATVAYACGYLNNASFTRAFSRRYGHAPTRLRTDEATA